MKHKSFQWLLVVLISACASIKPSTETWLIGPERKPCTGVGPMECLQIKRNPSDTAWQYFYDEIEGFQYEPGYTYTLEVSQVKKENVPADASSIQYKIEKLVSKKK
ncbi:MAG: DUF4377 domain-containing protein [Chitinophagaceae bacterium]|nr:DUF4377 domain-containing protein [Chitinophagaceae bacterium]